MVKSSQSTALASGDVLSPITNRVTTCSNQPQSFQREDYYKGQKV